MSRNEKDEHLATILEETLVEGAFYRKHCHRCMFWHPGRGCSQEGAFYRKHCHRCMFWHPGRGCSQNWHGCYYVQEELENRIEKAQKQKENECVREDCESCPFLKHRKNCRLICHMLEVTIG